jgi:molybdopterin-containing oxidoreductase family iron-sulfur binding subunit
MKFLGELSQKFSANEGEGLAFLVESSTSPSRARLQKIIAQKFPKAQWIVADAIDSGIHQRAATQAFGQSVRPVFNYDKAKVILSLDCDFLGGEDDSHNNIRKFTAGRKSVTGMSRLYAVESLFTLTGGSADHRMRLPASQVIKVASAILASIMGGAAPMSNWLAECAKDLIANRGNVLVVAGQRQPLEVHLLAHAINTALDSIGNTVTLIPTTAAAHGLNDLEASSADTLVILGGNPVYQFNWTPKAKTVVRLGYYEDETFAKANWNFPATHFLESWGDATTLDGSVVPVQPLTQPLFGGVTDLEFLAVIAGETQTSAHDIVRATFGGSEESWKKFLFNGFAAASPKSISNVTLAQSASELNRLVAAVNAPTLGKDNLEVVFFRDAKTDDGRYANNGWMQELPEPITKMTWDNAVLVSRKTANELGVANGDVVEISLGGKKVSGPIWVQPGMADFSLGLALGYGRERAGRVGNGVGFNAYKIFSGKYIETGAKISKTGETHVLACTQHHWSMEGRPAVREANLEEFLKEPEFAQEKFPSKSSIINKKTLCSLRSLR